MKTIQTIYKRRHFRSLLETRWAVFFETLGIPWEYEPEGLDLDGKWYLPDFYLRDINCYVEIKPGGAEVPPLSMHPNHVMFDYLHNHWEDLDSFPHRFVLISGNPNVSEYNGFITNDDCYQWCECPSCGRIDIQFDGRSGRIKCGCKHDGDKGYNRESPRLIQAYNMAMAYRPDVKYE